ncbi:hypothetical protein AOQ84DRAFT_358919, partial [Glonium stellatum]
AGRQAPSHARRSAQRGAAAELGIGRSPAVLAATRLRIPGSAPWLVAHKPGTGFSAQQTHCRDRGGGVPHVLGGVVSFAVAGVLRPRGRGGPGFGEGQQQQRLGSWRGDAASRAFRSPGSGTSFAVAVVSIDAIECYIPTGSQPRKAILSVRHGRVDAAFRYPTPWLPELDRGSWNWTYQDFLYTVEFVILVLLRLAVCTLHFQLTA